MPAFSTARVIPEAAGARAFSVVVKPLLVAARDEARTSVREADAAPALVAVTVRTRAPEAPAPACSGEVPATASRRSATKTSGRRRLGEARCVPRSPAGRTLVALVVPPGGAGRVAAPRTSLVPERRLGPSTEPFTAAAITRPERRPTRPTNTKPIPSVQERSRRSRPSRRSGLEPWREALVVVRVRAREDARPPRGRPCAMFGPTERDRPVRP